MRATRTPHVVPVFALGSLSEEAVRVIEVEAFDPFDAYLKALDQVADEEYIVEERIAPA